MVHAYLLDMFSRIESGMPHLGGVYMTPGRLSGRDEFTPVPSHGSTFVYMIPPQKSCRREFTPVVAPGREFHSSTKIGLPVDWNG